MSSLYIASVLFDVQVDGLPLSKNLTFKGLNFPGFISVGKSEDHFNTEKKIQSFIGH